MDTVLITAIGSFSAAIAIKTCKEKLNMRVVGCDIYDEKLVVSSKDVDVFYKVPYAKDNDKYLEFIYDICKKENVGYILPSTDDEVDVLNEHRKELNELGIVLCLSPYATIHICRDKLLSAKTIPDIIETSCYNEKAELTYPCILKPLNGRSSIGLYKLYSKEDMLPKIDSGNYITQPLIEGNVVTVDVVRHSKKRHIEVLARKELLRTYNGAGLSVHIFRDDKLEDRCKQIANMLDINGCVCFEFILDKTGKYHMLECNPRLSGGVAFSCMAGYDFVKAHFDSFMADDIEPQKEIKDMYIARRYTEYIMD